MDGWTDGQSDRHRAGWKKKCKEGNRDSPGMQMPIGDIWLTRPSARRIFQCLMHTPNVRMDRFAHEPMQLYRVHICKPLSHCLERPGQESGPLAWAR